MKISVFTVIMAEHTVQSAARELAQIGYDGVEWRVHPDFHIHPREVVERAVEVKQLSDEHGLELPLLGTYVRVHDIEQLGRCCLAAATLGCPNIRIALRRRYEAGQPFVRQLDEARDDLTHAQAVLETYGVRGLFETHHGTVAESASGMRRLLDGFSTESFGAILDPGNMIIAGHEGWPMGIDILGPYLAHVHVKNVSWRRNAKGRWCWANDTLKGGMVDWAKVIRALRNSSYEGYLSVEDLYGVRLDTTGFAGEQLESGTQDEVSIRDKLIDDFAFLTKCINE